MRGELVPTPKVPKYRLLTIALIAEAYRLRMLQYSRSARALRTLDMKSSTLIMLMILMIITLDCTYFDRESKMIRNLRQKSPTMTCQEEAGHQGMFVNIMM